MLEKFTYTNSFNETLEFGKDCLFVNENDLRDFAWEIATKNNKISRFSKGIVNKTIPVILMCKSEAEGVEMRNRLFEVFEKDVLASQYGKIQIGDYYLRCYITGAKKSQYLIQKSHMVISLTVQTDMPEWVKETTTTHTMDSRTTEPYLDYSFDYPHDYKNELVNTNINNTHFVPSNFIITIFGFCTNPELYIGEHKYAVNVTVAENEYLTIDSRQKTITLTRISGEKVNCFNDRHRDSYIFEKVKPGYNIITSPNTQIQFNVTLLEERSEPKWT